MLKAATIGIPLTKSMSVLKKPPKRTSTLDNTHRQETQSLTPTRASIKRDMLTSTSTMGQLDPQKDVLRRPKTSNQRQKLRINRLKKPQAGSSDVNSCEVIVDDLFNMEVKMKPV